MEAFPLSSLSIDLPRSPGTHRRLPICCQEAPYGGGGRQEFLRSSVRPGETSEPLSPPRRQSCHRHLVHPPRAQPGPSEHRPPPPPPGLNPAGGDGPGLHTPPPRSARKPGGCEQSHMAQIPASRRQAGLGPQLPATLWRKIFTSKYVPVCRISASSLGFCPHRLGRSSAWLGKVRLPGELTAMSRAAPDVGAPRAGGSDAHQGLWVPRGDGEARAQPAGCIRLPSEPRPTASAHECPQTVSSQKKASPPRRHTQSPPAPWGYIPPQQASPGPAWTLPLTSRSSLHWRCGTCPEDRLVPLCAMRGQPACGRRKHGAGPEVGGGGPPDPIKWG